MSSVQWQQIRSIFEQCVDLPIHEQSDFLRDTCNGDGAILVEIQQLLDGHVVAESTEFMKWPASAGDPTADHRFSPGSSIGDYEIIEPIGVGGTGTVYRAKKNGLELEVVAIKVLQPWSRNAEGLARFQIEKYALARLDHPGIAKLLDDGVCNDGSPFLVMEFVEGKQLDVLLNTDEISMRQRVVCFRAICDAMATAHEHQILHRDLKPANIIIDTNGKPVITDFGLAKFLEPTIAENHLTTTGRIMGTPKYMAPEQAAGSSSLGMTTDVYGLGAVLYFMLTKRPPFDGNSFINIGTAIQNDLPVSPRTISRELNRDLETICLKCLNKQPAQRYPTVAALTGDVDHYLQGQPISARPPNSLERLTYWSKRNPAFATLSCGLILIVAAGIISLTLLWQTSQRNFVRAENKTAQLLNTIDQLTQTVDEYEVEPTTLHVRRDVLLSITQAYDDSAAFGPLDHDALYGSAVAWFKLGRIENNLADNERKGDCYRQAESRFRKLISFEPDNLKYQFDLYHCLVSQSRHGEAYEVIQNVVRADTSENLDYLDGFGNALHWQSTVLIANGKYDQAVHVSNEGVHLAKEYFETENSIPRYRRQLGIQLHDRAVAKWMLGDLNTARVDLDQSIEIGSHLLRLDPNNDGFYLDLSIRLSMAVSAALFQDDLDSARDRLDTAEQISREYLSAFPTHFAAWARRSKASKLEWIFCCEHGSPDEQDAAAVRYLQRLRKWLDQFPDHYRAQLELALFLSHPANRSPDLSQAKKLYDRVDLEKHGYYAGTRIAILAFRFGELELAEPVFERALTRYSDFTRHEHYLRAIKVLRNGTDDVETSGWLPDRETHRKSIGISGDYIDVFSAAYFQAEYEAVRDSIRLENK